MVFKTQKNKLTCFLCRYVITKHNRYEKQIKFNGKLKPICKHCTKNNHKGLDNKHKNIDLQCKICEKPSRYNNCIACSICNHLFHGKCLDLNKNDINEIEKVCNFFMCTECNNAILPNQLDTEEQKSKSSHNIKSNQRQCLTCNNTVPKTIYPNKHIIYNEQRHILCQECSKLGLNIPVRDKTMIEFQDCAICKKQVKYIVTFANT